ncbi:MAG TPA: calcium-binding protein, partial [Pirellulaceae bacterium]|nr:calcium-binding protein [Pirellulaceae bacterium]
LLTTDQPGLDADLAIEEAISSAAGLVLRSADNAIVRGPLTAATTIDIAIDTANADPGEGNTLVLLAAIIAPGGTTAAGNSDADRFEIVPQTGSALLIVGGLPIAPQSNPQSQNTTSGDVFGDKLVLDMTTAGDGQATLGPVIVDSVGGRATAENTRLLTYRGIEDLDLFDGSLLTTTQQGDIYVRGTGADERIYITHDGGTNPQVRVSVAGRTFPGSQGYFGPYVRGRSVIVYARGGHDLVELSSTPLRGEFHGEGGDDYLSAASFADLLIGGPGSDTLIGGSKGGHDELWGDDFDPIPQDDQSQPIANPTAAQLQQNREHWALLVSATDGPDKLSTTSGNDRLYGQGGDDQLNPGAGDDYASGGSGNDKISGGDGNDRLYGDGGNDELAGDAGSDLLSGGDGNDVLAGHRGNDVLIGGDGADNLHGIEGNDLLFAGRLALAGGDEDSTVAGDARDAALLALLLEWSTLGQATGATSAGDDGDLDWLYGYAGSDRFVGDGSSRNYDFEAGVDAVG